LDQHIKDMCSRYGALVNYQVIHPDNKDRKFLKCFEKQMLWLTIFDVFAFFLFSLCPL
jgi:hypothetical protein